jgi:predicted PurR-regulated permease PerM
MANVQNAFKYTILAVLTALFFVLIFPFLPAIVFAIVFSIIFHPIYDFFIKKWHFPDTLSAVAVVLLTFIFIVTPLVLLIGLIAQEIFTFVTTFDFNGFYTWISQYSTIQAFGFTIDLSQYTESFIGVLQQAGSKVGEQAGGLIGVITGTAFLFFVFLFVYFFFLRDGHLLVKKCRYILPFTKEQNKQIFYDFYSTSKTVFTGYLIAAVLSGLLAYIAFTLFGIPGAPIWGLSAALLSLVPKIGTVLIYGVGAIIAGILGGIWAGLGFVAYYIVFEIVGMQAVIRPKFVDEKISMHPVLVFFSLVGGILTFGTIGIIYGPLIMVLFVSIFEFVVGTRHTVEGKN